MFIYNHIVARSGTFMFRMKTENYVIISIISKELGTLIVTALRWLWV